MGAPKEVLDQFAPVVKVFEVFEDNWTTVEIFQRLSTQWVWSSGGGAIGLHYPSMDFLFKLFGVKERRRVFQNLQIMEIAAINAWSEKKG